MSVSQACNYTLTALQQQFSACGNGPNTNAVANCHCTVLGEPPFSLRLIVLTILPRPGVGQCLL
ncbi:hypothetical protein BCR33DRAFT_721039 [Rhizoclosmatium globosum]|uniref:Uncharacterized protein n=1 Tax=Rhizoclosmatium globosum TaxID=329046 RepID=A0A1Y2BTH2_9FUNG|nr:hypothetical protein BCR33DRAFT_721039 [Rhizoclosmatium globosum]|eukprot:ORY38058.1 hypothetical protein BCR33DRAFT_721039 [Rhizoclosmatium globosum]